jgi:hypothetical protein
MLLSLADPLILVLFPEVEKTTLLVGLAGVAIIGAITFLATQNIITM